MKYSDIWAKPVHTSATDFMRLAPPEFNEDLDRPTATSPIPEREQHAYLLRHTAVEPVARGVARGVCGKYVDQRS